MSENNSTNLDTTDDINIGKLVGDVLARKWLIISVTLISCLVASVYAMVAVPVYKGNALIQVEESSSGVLSLDDIGDMFAVESSTDTEIYILRSRLIVGNTVDELNLAVEVEPQYFPFIGKFFARRHHQQGLAETKWGSFYSWGGEEVTVADFEVKDELLMKSFTLVAGNNNQFSLWLDGVKILKGTVGERVVDSNYGVEINIAKLVAHPGTRFNLVKQPRLKAIMSLQRDFKAHNLGKDANIIELSLKGENKQLITSILDSLSSNYILQNVQRLAAEAENSLAFLDEQIPLVRLSLNESEKALNDYRAKQDSVDLSLETKSLLESLVSLEAEISSMAISEAELSRRFTQEHPSYLSFKRQQFDLSLQRDRLNAKITSLPETQQKILSLMRDFEVNQSIYVSLQNKTQELAIVKASTVGNVRILDTAAVFPKPSAPNRPLIVLLSSILGFMLSIVYALIRASLIRGVANPRELQDAGFNIYAIVPVSPVQLKFDLKADSASKTADSPAELLLADNHPADMSIEAIRSLRTSLHFSMLEAKNNILMISSASPGVGKTFVTANTGVVFANSGQKVLIIDADMRRGYLHNRLEIKLGKGLSDYLLNDTSIDDVVRTTKIKDLDFISRGFIPANPSEILMSVKFSTFLEQLSKKYDVIIIDTPPVLAVTDASIIGRLAGTSMLVARYKRCTIKSIKESSSRFNLNGIEVKGLIFNAVESKLGDYYDYADYGYGSYAYSYLPKGS